MPAETDESRVKRLRQRMLFDLVADVYDTSRRGYPQEIVELVVANAALDSGAAVLEVGCGTGQLTEQLTPFGFDLTAIDIGPSMVAAARRRVDGLEVTFEVVSFEDFDAAGRSFDLIVSATAFHWVDPEVGYAKAAHMLRSEGWLALLGTGERYDEPLRSALRGMWLARSDDGGAWLNDKRMTETERIDATGLYDAPLTRGHTERMTLPAAVVLDLEQTRATMLSWDSDARAEFVEELRELVRSSPVVELDQVTELTMARRRPRP